MHRQHKSVYRENGIIQGTSIPCGFKYQVKGNRQNTACDCMPLQMSVWLLMNILLVFSLIAVAALPSYTETSVHGVLHIRCKEKYLGFFCCRVSSAKSVWWLLRADGVENL